jgi:Glycerophosphoryl diester phosphodiesterase family
VITYSVSPLQPQEMKGRLTLFSPRTCLVVAAFSVASTATPGGAVKGYLREVPPEPPASREVRHQQVAARRAGPVIIAHRGASAFAPENTLEAYAAAMDYGADGCEVDIRRTADGVLVLFHDDMLDRLTEGIGAVNQVTYDELLASQPRFTYGRATAETRVPTFAALLVLARQRTMLLHLDVKEPDLEAEIVRLLDAADAWDHVVAVNEWNASRIRQHPKLKLLAYRAPGLQEDRRDMDPTAVRETLGRPGNMIMVDDPRLAAHELKRKPYQPVRLPDGLRAAIVPKAAPHSQGTQSFDAAACVRSLERRIPRSRPGSVAELAAMLKADFPERNQLNGDAEEQRLRTERIIERAWAAQRLGWKGYQLAGLEKVLEQAVLERSLHRDWTLHGLDGALAGRALGLRGATGSTPVLVAAFLRVDPELRTVANPQWSNYPPAWADFHFKMHLLPALGQLRCEASKRFLQDYVNLSEAAARELAPLMFEEATQALLRQELTRDELVALMKSPRSAVRGTTILECLDHPNKGRAAALKPAAPWALALPGAGH